MRKRNALRIGAIDPRRGCGDGERWPPSRSRELPFYDATKKVEVKGTVTKLIVRNRIIPTDVDENGEKSSGRSNELGPTGQDNLTVETLKPGPRSGVRSAVTPRVRTGCAASRLMKPTGLQSSAGVPRDPQ
jgi:hypothetical protein